MAKRKDFSELTRVQIPAALHLMRMGYIYLPRNGKEIAERDPDTNILVSIFKKQFLKFNNYSTEDDFERELANIKLELDQNDLGRSFFKRLQGQEDAIYIDWEHPEANTFHLALEVTCQNGQDEFRPDIVIFINGLPLSYIEVKQPNAIRDGKTGIQSEQDRTRYRFENRKFRRFNNITQLIALSDNLPYISGQGQQKQGSYYGSNAYSKTKFNAFKEEREEDFLHSFATLTENQIDFVLEDMKRFALKSQPEFTTNLNPDTPCNTFLSSLYQKERLLFMLRFGLVFDDQTIGGMIVCDSSKQARELEKQLEERRQAGSTKLTSALILHDEGDKEEKKDKVDAYKEGKIDLIIVYSMLLTGFDAPRLKRLYLGRKIKAHNLLQTLTRVNRPYKDYLFGYVIDFADISKEFDKTNRAYLEELNQEYDTTLTGENGEDVFGSLFVSADEISQELSKTEHILIDYPTDNLEYFSQAINDIKDKKQLIDLRKALESIKQYYNIARLLGYQHLLQQIDIAQIATLLNVLSRRMLTLSLIDKPDDFSSRTLLNLAMSETSFSFVKIAEEELRLAANDLEDLKRRVASGIKNQRDEKDPEWVSLYEEFQRIMKKHLIHGQEGFTMENIKETQKDYEELFKSVEDYHTRMRRLTMNFNGDEMAARSYKHVTNSTMVSEFPAIYHVIKGSKVRLDRKIGQNQGVLDNEDFLKKMIREEARIEMKTNQSASSLTREDFNYIVESLFEGYEEEYQH